MFNALVVILLGSVALGVAFTNLPDWVRIGLIGVFLIGLLWMTWWVNTAMRRHPREMSYGPNELIEESRLSHERKMAGKE